jgi:hypothetical protein
MPIVIFLIGIAACDKFGLNIIETGPLQFANAGQERVYDAGSACLIDRKAAASIWAARRQRQNRDRGGCRP